tara:strand:+ start:471 stop:1889 length:1419 start_codon:yes stop_codon:yes gene_type:complete
MNRTLKRPMFKMGGSTNSGIVSGLNKPRQQYSEGSKPRQQYSEGTTLERLQKAAGARDFGIEEFLIPFGLNLASATPRGNIIATAAEAAKKPASQLLQSKRAEDAFQRELGLKAEMIDIEEESKGTTLASTKKVLDVDTGNEVFATEKQIQSTMSSKDGTQMKYVPIPSAEKKEKPMAVYDTITKSEVFALPSELLSKTDDGNLRFLPIGKADQLVRAYPIVDGKTVPKPIFVTKAEVIANPKLYEPVEGNIEMMLKVDDFKQEKQIKQDATKQMLAARDVSSIIRRLEKDIMDGGAFTGNAGDTVGFLTGVSGFVDQFVNKQRDADKTLYNQQYRDAAEAIEILQNDDTINAKLTRFLNAPETQAAKTSVVNLAYALAKAREPGGRFSVADIELALRSIGESSNKMSFLAGLKRTGLEATERAIKDYETVFNLTREDLPIKFKEVIDNYNYFGGFEVKGDGDLKPGDLEFD